jgi:hypothetical protein
MDGHEIQMRIQFRQRLRAGVDHHHIVLVLAEFFRQMLARLAATDDQYAHGSLSVPVLNFAPLSPSPPRLARWKP